MKVCCHDIRLYVLGGYNEDGFLRSHLAQYEVIANEEKRDSPTNSNPNIKRNIVKFANKQKPNLLSLAFK